MDGDGLRCGMQVVRGPRLETGASADGVQDMSFTTDVKTREYWPLCLVAPVFNHDMPEKGD